MGLCTVPRLLALCLVLNRFQLPAHDVHLRVQDGENVAVCLSRVGGVSFDLELHAILCVDEPLAVAVQGCVRHGPQVDEEAKLAACEIFGQIHVGPAVRARTVNPGARVRSEEAGHLLPNVGATVLTSRWPLPCRVVSAMDRRSMKRPNLLPVRYLVRSMLGLP